MRGTRRALLLLCLALACGGTDCTPETRHEMARVLLDGYDDPAPILETDALRRSADDPTSFVAAQVHVPFQQRQCSRCHGTERRSDEDFKISGPTRFCLECHDTIQTPPDGQWLHGPVAAAACTRCHHPHSSPDRPLLRTREQELCLQCHAQADVMANPVHGGIGEQSCLDCHHGHTGTSRMLLRSRDERP